MKYITFTIYYTYTKINEFAIEIIENPLVIHEFAYENQFILTP